jgi:hypothetical protein
VTVLHVVIVAVAATSITRIVYTNYLIEGVVLAPGGAKKVFNYAANSSAGLRTGSNINRVLQLFSRRIGVVNDSGDSSAMFPAQRLGSASSASSSASNSAAAASSRVFRSPAKRAFDNDIELNDSRFYNISLADDKLGAPLGTFLETGNAMEDSSLLFQSFMFEFSKYRAGLLQQEDVKLAQFESEWRGANDYMWGVRGTLLELTEDPEEEPAASSPSSSLAACVSRSTHFPSDKVRITRELAAVYAQSDRVVPVFKQYLQEDPDQFGVRLMAIFMVDLLGKDSLPSRVIHMLLREALQDDVLYLDVRNWVKFLALAFILATDACLVYGSVMLLQHWAAKRQWYWIITSAIAIGVDVFVVETVEAVWFKWAIPLCVADTLVAAKSTLLDVFAQFERQLREAPAARLHSAATGAATRPKSALSLFSNSNGTSRPGTGTGTGAGRAAYSGHADTDAGASFKNFSMPDYQFVSTNLAHRFPKHIASRLVLSYESVFPRTITSKYWPGHVTTAQLLCQGRQWTSGHGVESIGYVVFSSAAMWVSVHCPVFVQQIVLTGLVSLSTWLASSLVFTVLRGDYDGLYVLAGVLGAALFVYFSYSFAFDHDSDHYEEGLGGLAVVDAASLHLSSQQQQHARAHYHGVDIHATSKHPSGNPTAAELQQQQQQQQRMEARKASASFSIQQNSLGGDGSSGPKIDHFPPAPASGVGQTSVSFAEPSTNDGGDDDNDGNGIFGNNLGGESDSSFGAGGSRLTIAVEAALRAAAAPPPPQAPSNHFELSSSEDDSDNSDAKQDTKPRRK